MERVRRIVVPLLAGLLVLGPALALTSGLGVGENVPVFYVNAVAGPQAGQKLCYV